MESVLYRNGAGRPTFVLSIGRLKLHSAGGAAPEVLLQDRLAKGRERLDHAPAGADHKIGIANAIASQLGRLKDDRNAIAETIEISV
jgi:hypothetical protein